MTAAMPQATMNGQQINWGQAPAQSDGKRWGRLAIKLAIGVGVVFVAGWGLGYIPGMDGIFTTAATLATSIAASTAGLTESLSQFVEHLTGLNADSSVSAIEHAKSGLTELAAELTPANDEFVLKDIWATLATPAQSNITTELVTVSDTLTELSANVGAHTPEALAAAKTSIEGNFADIVEQIKTTSGLAEDAKIQAITELGSTMEAGFNDIGGGVGLLDLKTEHYAMAAGGAGAGVIASKLLGGNNATQRLTPANQNRVPPAPHPSAVRANTGKFTQKYHNQDLANHLNANGFAVEGSPQPPQRTV